MKKEVILLSLFALLGIFLLRGGITGNVITGSCCFPPGCPQEQMCPAVAATIDTPASLTPDENNMLSLLGVLVAVISIAMMTSYLKKRVDEQKKQEI